MRRILSYWPHVALVVACALIVSLQISAQEAVPVQQPDQAKEIAALKQQIAQLQQKTPAEQIKAAQDGYTAIFKEAKAKIGFGCQEVGGRWVIMVGFDGKASAGCIQR